jgi:hypothetical protein
MVRRRLPSWIIANPVPVVEGFDVAVKEKYLSVVVSILDAIQKIAV